MTDTRDYYRTSTSWALDTQALAARSRRVAWTVAGTAVAVALFEAVALAMLAPLKSVQTVTLLVDKQTGYVQALDPLQPRRMLADDALTNSYLAQYVTSREEFDRATVSADYRKVALWSAGRARATYLSSMPASNPASPFQRVPPGVTVQSTIKSVSRLQAGFAMVRFDTATVDRSGQRSASQPWVAMVRFRYVDAPMRLEDRLINPLGFQVIGYRRDAEAPPPPPPSVLSTTPTASVPPAAPAVTTTVTETRRSVTRSARPLPRPQASIARYPRLSATGGGNAVLTAREVPLNQLPLGSPLVSANAATPIVGTRK